MQSFPGFAAPYPPDLPTILGQLNQPRFVFVFEATLYFLFRQAGFCLIFALSKNKGFRSGALLKLRPSSLFMKEFHQ